MNNYLHTADFALIRTENTLLSAFSCNTLSNISFPPVTRALDCDDDPDCVSEEQSRWR